jgi:hypothetical protein
LIGSMKPPSRKKHRRPKPVYVPLAHSIPRGERHSRSTSPNGRTTIWSELRIPISSSQDFATIAEVWEAWSAERWADRRDACLYSGGFFYQVGELKDDGQTVRWQRGVFPLSTVYYGNKDPQGSPSPPAFAWCVEDLAGRLRRVGDLDGELEGEKEGIASRVRIRIRSLFIRLVSAKGGYPSESEDVRSADLEFKERSKRAKAGWKTRHKHERKAKREASRRAKAGWKTRREHASGRSHKAAKGARVRCRVRH